MLHFVFFQPCSSHAITSDINISETVKAAEFFLVDGVILTGSATGDPVDVQELNGTISIFLIKMLLCILFTHKIKLIMYRS